MIPPMMTAGQVALTLGCHPSTVRKKAKRGELPGRKVAGMLRFRREEIEALICQERTEASISPAAADQGCGSSNGWTPASVGPDLLARATSALRSKR